MKHLAARARFYRDAEAAGCRLLGLLLKKMPEPHHQKLLHRQLSDEHLHASLWTELLEELGEEHDPHLPSYYPVLRREIAEMPKTVGQLLALSVAVEQRALEVYTEHLRWEQSAKVRLILKRVMGAEGWHLRWLREEGELRDGMVRFARNLDRYEQDEARAYRQMEQAFYHSFPEAQ